METVETRVPKSSFSGIKGAKKEQKLLEKSSTSYLGPGCREFESRHSDQVRIIRTQSSKLEMCSDFPFLSNIYSDKIWAGSIPALVALMNSGGESIRSSATIILYLSFIFVKDYGNIFLRHKLNNFADRCAFLFR